MTTIYPGATWVPVPGQQNRPRRRKGRGVGYHVAVYAGPSIEKIDESTGNDSHLYVRFDGSVEQNVDLDVISYAMVDGNATMITVETEGGANPATVNTEPWTAAQLSTLAGIARWANTTEGVPLQLMPDSKPASRGLAPHRLGIQHSRGIGAVPGWLVAGGERWSTVLGKECPGDAKVAQMPEILSLALNGDDMPLTDADVEKIFDYQLAYPENITDRYGTVIHKAGDLIAVKDLLRWQEAREVRDRQTVLGDLEGNMPKGHANFEWVVAQVGAQVAGLASVVQALAQAPGGLSAEQITAAAQAGADQALAELGKQLASGSAATPPAA